MRKKFANGNYAQNGLLNYLSLNDNYAAPPKYHWPIN
jgi:hypothetical protein